MHLGISGKMSLCPGKSNSDTPIYHKTDILFLILIHISYYYRYNILWRGADESELLNYIMKFKFQPEGYVSCCNIFYR